METATASSANDPAGFITFQVVLLILRTVGYVLRVPRTMIAAMYDRAIADCVSERNQPSRAGKSAFIEQFHHLSGIHGSQKGKHTGNRART